ncbi:Cu(I)/Ag(I) efflux system membrane fusion protein [Saonia flava]|uniref:Cu(I)/Ag(I) efflux system membrane fusion protein n=1 Tax=Saonia flava TaxID=523696 RepID=A0A846R2H0_9FLAO|nr:efflux RND transporter periplasmic adaptor subunit [Saonia flava]NJB71019.1 Cu(I)/Ag(I) efflux system membrane fusion protein [Saonia flava]
MKKTSIYIAVAAITGLLAGYLIFGIRTEEKTISTHNHAGETADQMWTCSMHPQIMQHEPGDCPLCGMDLIPAEAGADGLSPGQFKMTDNALALANIQTTVVGGQTDEVNSTISLSGKIAVNKEAVALQASYFDGRIEQLNVNYEGQKVRNGQLLATIYSPELVAAQQELLTAASLKSSQPQLYNAVKNKLKLWKLSEGQINTIETSGKVKENFPIYTTVSGTVSEVMSAEGDYVKKGQPIAKVNNLNTVWVEFDAYENQLSQISQGQKISIVSNAYPDELFQGRISFIDPVLNNSTRTVTVRATLRNSNDIFKPGMFVMGKIMTSPNLEQVATLSVPSSAVMWTGERSVVYLKVKADEPVFEMREVTVGARKGEQMEVISGLSLGEEIVTNGTFSVDATAQLKGKKSMMNKKAGKTMTGHEGHIGMQDIKEKGGIESTRDMKFPDRFQNEFQTILVSYLKLKDAFVASDSDQTAYLAKTILTELKKLNLKDLGAMEKAHLVKGMEMLEAIAKKKDLENQRAHFVIFNENIIAITSGLKFVNNAIYVQHCPMADSNKGAKWLSAEKEVRNPYFGDAMLTCGSVIDSLK